MTCKHRKSWLLLGGSLEWCHVCGAWRRLRPVSELSVAADGPWCYVGMEHEDFVKSEQRYRRQMFTRRQNRAAAR